MKLKYFDIWINSRSRFSVCLQETGFGFNILFIYNLMVSWSGFQKSRSGFGLIKQSLNIVHHIRTGIRPLNPNELTWTFRTMSSCCAHCLLTHWSREKMAPIFKYILLNEDVWISIKNLMRFVLNNWPMHKSLSESVMRFLWEAYMRHPASMNSSCRIVNHFADYIFRCIFVNEKSCN